MFHQDARNIKCHNASSDQLPDSINVHPLKMMANQITNKN